MSTRIKRLGYIRRVTYGLCGYNNAELGLSLGLACCAPGNTWNVTDVISCWDYTKVKGSDDSKWTEGERTECYVTVAQRISELLRGAGVDTVDQLEGKPIEAVFDDNRTLVEWRILIEMLRPKGDKKDA